MEKIDINEILKNNLTKVQMSYYAKENIIYVDKETTSISGRFQFLKKFNQECLKCKKYIFCNLIIDNAEKQIINIMHCDKLIIRTNNIMQTFKKINLEEGKYNDIKIINRGKNKK